MHTDWLAPEPEAVVLSRVHRRARVIANRRMMRRSTALVGAVAMVATAGAVAFSEQLRPATVRTLSTSETPAGDDTADPADPDAITDGSGAPNDRATTSSREARDEDGFRITTTNPVTGEDEEVTVQPRSTADSRRPHVIADPEGDDVPDNDGLDLVWGDIEYLRSRDALAFVVGVTDLAVAPTQAMYTFSFRHDGLVYDVSVHRRDGGYTVYQGEACSVCAAVFDERRDVVTIEVPLGWLNERVRARTEGVAGGKPSPPIRRETVLSALFVSSFDNSATVTGVQHDNAEAPRGATWTMP